MFVFNETTGEWIVENNTNGTVKLATVQQDSSNRLFVQFTATHLTWWNLDWKTSICAFGEPEVRVVDASGNLVPNSYVYIKGFSWIYCLNYAYDGVMKFLMAPATDIEWKVWAWKDGISSEVATISQCKEKSSGNAKFNLVLNTNIKCYDDWQCNDNNSLTYDYCRNPGLTSSYCENIACTSACSQDSDCSSLGYQYCYSRNSCYAHCGNAACYQDSDCIAANNGKKCSNPGKIDAYCFACSANSDCDDTDSHTTDVCNFPGTTYSQCLHQTIACLNDTECDDSDSQTTDICLNPNTINAYCLNASVSASVASTSLVLANGYASTTLTCTVTGNATYVEGKCDTSSSWSQISGSTLTCAYYTKGNYTPGCRLNGVISADVQNPIVVFNPPTASASATPKTGASPLNVDFTGGCTYADGTCVTYLWDFGDGSPTSSLQNPTHTYTTNGLFTATLTVTDSDGGTAQAFVLISTTGTNPFTALEAGNAQSCVILTDNTVKCWGYYDGGSATQTSLIPVTISGITNAASISAGASTCTVLSNGTVECWGSNFYGQLGNGTTTSSATPVTVSGLSGVSAVSSGYSHACALLTGGSVKCWGYNGHGQLGNGSTTDSYTPVTVNGISNAIAISAGEWHSCALLSSGDVQCWGSNTNGELGNGTTTDSTTPINVNGISGATSISASAFFTCALMSDSSVKCWGYNLYGQLGNGSIADSYTPVAVSGINNAIAISTGGLHTCALLADNTINCWGYNGVGELGNGTATNSSTPVAVSGLSNAIGMSAGDYHTCALTSDGNIKCWGYNNSGQLGDGTTTARVVPTTVLF